MRNLEYFREFMISEKNSENTIRNYMSDVRQMHKIVGKEDSEITYLDLITWKKETMKLSSATVDRRVHAIKKYFDFLYNANYIAKNPAEKLSGTKVRNAEKRAFTEDELKKMIDVAQNSRDKAILLTLASTAMRVSEVIDLNLSDFDKDEIQIVGKGDKPRVVYLNPETREAIETYLLTRLPGCDKLFTSRYGTPMTEKSISLMLKRLARATGLFEDVSWITPHTMRRTRITHWSKNGVPLASIMYSAGHSNIKTTMRYIKNTNNECVREAMMMGV